MYIYKLTMTYDDELTNVVRWESQYLTHRDNYDKNIFDFICAGAKQQCKRENKNVDLKNLKKILIRDYAFKDLIVHTNYDFQGE